MTTLTEFSIHKDEITINWLVRTEPSGGVHIFRDVDGCVGVDFIAIDPEAFAPIAAALLAAAQERRPRFVPADPIVVQFPRTLRSETRHGTVR